MMGKAATPAQIAYVNRMVKSSCPCCGRRPSYRMIGDMVGLCFTTVHKIAVRRLRRAK